MKSILSALFGQKQSNQYAYIKEGKIIAVGRKKASKNGKVKFKPFMGFEYWVNEKHLRIV